MDAKKELQTPEDGVLQREEELPEIIERIRTRSCSRISGTAPPSSDGCRTSMRWRALFL
jgi:hypothetical protein